MLRELEQAEHKPHLYSVSEGYRQIQSWDEISLPSELDTPEKRFASALNIIQNGAQSLTVITMSAHQQMTTPYYINRRMNEAIGVNVVSDRTTRSHLIGTIERVGAAARSTLDDREWALTDFGVALRPAIIYSQRNILDLGFDPMDVLATISSLKLDEKGDIASTPAAARAKILLALAEYGILREADLARVTGLDNYTTGTHLKLLTGSEKEDGKRLIIYESRTHEPGKPTTEFFIPDDHTGNIEEWPIATRIRKDRNGVLLYVSGTETMRKAVKGLLAAGESITYQSIREWIKNNMQSQISVSDISTILSFWNREGFIDKGSFHNKKLTSAMLTIEGELIANEVLRPLQEWSKDPSSVEGINQIAQQLERGESFQPLLKFIARSFRDRSPAVNKDSEAKQGEALAYIRNFSGAITHTDLARLMNIPIGSVRIHVRPLIASGEIIERKGPRNKKFLEVSTPLEAQEK